MCSAEKFEIQTQRHLFPQITWEAPRWQTFCACSRRLGRPHNYAEITAESCTGGMLAMRITDIPGSSDVFRTGLVTYANETKTRLLNVPEDMLRAHGAVSEEVARAMAEGVKRDAGSTYGISITGIAGPDGGSAEKPLGLVYIALATPNETYCLRMQPKGIYRGRSFVRERSVGKALDMLRRYLDGYPVLHELI